MNGVKILGTVVGTTLIVMGIGLIIWAPKNVPTVQECVQWEVTQPASSASTDIHVAVYEWCYSSGDHVRCGFGENVTTIYTGTTRAINQQCK